MGHRTTATLVKHERYGATGLQPTLMLVIAILLLLAMLVIAEGSVGGAVVTETVAFVVGVWLVKV